LRLLHATILPAPRPVSYTALLLHGILGSGRNLRTFGTLLARAVPGLQVVTLDLRGHGESQGLPPPHTVAACADDVIALAQHLGLRRWAVVGHSFGGKVALQIALQVAQSVAVGLVHAAVLDAVPGPRQGDATEAEVDRLVASLHVCPQPLPSRQAFADHMAWRGHDPALAGWLATQLKPTPDGFRLRLDLPAIDALLADYFALDLWPALERPPPGIALHLVRAGRGDRWTPTVLARLAACTAVQVSELANAGHWLHADDPQGLAEVLARGWR
jgi:pimeloyl-ACP methyl ester carboxylesterase